MEESILAICNYGGNFDSNDPTMPYAGGEAHAVDISRNMTLEDFKREISEMFKIECSAISIKYRRNKRFFTKVHTDKDLHHMVNVNIESGDADVYISKVIQADNRSKVADSGTSINGMTVNVESKSPPNTKKNSKRMKVGDSGTSIDGTAANVGSQRTPDTRVTRSSVSPSVEAMQHGEGSTADAGRSSKKTRKRLATTSDAPSAEAVKPGDGGADAVDGQNTKKTRKRVTRSSASASVEAMETGEGVAEADAGQSTQNTRKRVTRSSVTSVEDMKLVDGVAGGDAGESTKKARKRATKSSISPSAEATKPADGVAHAVPGQSMAEKLLRDARNLISTDELVRGKKLALEALKYDPLVEGADQIIAISDVLLAARERINGQIDWYAVLQLDLATSGNDPDTIRQHYRRLTLLLRTAHSSLPSAADALGLVANAWAVLSDPSRKFLYEAELAMGLVDLHSGSSSLKPPEAKKGATEQTFWTTCPKCFHAYQYDGVYEGRCLLCQNCRHAFLATAMPEAPRLVAGTETYYCSWAFFPIGFSSGVHDGYTSSAMHPTESPTKAGHLGDSLPRAGGEKVNAMGSKKTALPKRPQPASPTTALPEKPRPALAKKAQPALAKKPRPARKRKIAAKDTVETRSKRRVLVVEDEAKIGEVRPAAVGPEEGIAVAVVREGAPVLVEEIDATTSQEVRALAAGPEDCTEAPVAKSAPVLVVDAEATHEEVKSLAAVLEDYNAAPRATKAAPVLVVQSEPKDEEERLGAALKEDGGGMAVEENGAPELVVEPDSNSEDAGSVAALLEDCERVGAVINAAPVLVACAEARNEEEARSVAAMTENCYGVAVETNTAPLLVIEAETKSEEARSVAAVPEYCDGEGVLKRAETKTEEASSVAVRPEDCDGVAGATKSAPVVLDLNEDAAFWDTQNTGLMMDQYDIAGFDLDLDAVDLDAAGDLLGNLTNLSNDVQGRYP